LKLAVFPFGKHLESRSKNNLKQKTHHNCYKLDKISPGTNMYLDEESHQYLTCTDIPHPDIFSAIEYFLYIMLISAHSLSPHIAKAGDPFTFN